MQKSPVWQYCTKLNQNQSKCNICGVTLGSKGGNTTGLKNHLGKHAIVFNKTVPEQRNKDEVMNCAEKNLPEGGSSRILKNKCNSQSIVDLLKQETLASILARYISVDGFSIRAVFNSEGIKDHLRSKGYEMPKSQTTISNLILDYFNEKKYKVICHLTALKNKGARFSISIDEWCDVSMRRYLNITLHSNEKDYVLGLFPMLGSYDSMKTVELVKNSLMEFKIDLNKDIVASCNDGAAVMVKYGRLIEPLSQLCYNHAIHLSVTKVFYERVPKNMILLDSADITDDEDSNSGGLFDSGNNNQNAILICDTDSEFNYIPKTSIKDTLTILRSTVKFFKCSPLRTTVLNKWTLLQEPSPLKLLLDCKTRWNSIVPMIERVLRLEIPINNALDELGQKKIPNSHFTMLRNLLNIIKPIHMVVLELGKNTANLLTAEGSLIFLFTKLKEQTSEVGIEIYNKLKDEIEKRRNKSLVSLIYLLQNGVFPVSNEFLSYSTKEEILDFGESMSKRLFPAKYYHEDSKIFIKEPDRNQISEECELKNYINAVILAPKKVVESELRLEFLNLETIGARRSDRLQDLYECLTTIKPTSIASERVFSVANSKITRIRNRMSTKMLNAIVFLQYYFLSSIKKH